MELYSSLPYVNKKVSKIFFGMAQKVFQFGGDGNSLLDDVFALGINSFDLARNYLLSEQAFGNWINARGNREKVVILSKCGHPSIYGRPRITEKDIRKDFNKSSQNLQTDYIDIYLFHRDNENIPVEIAVETMNALHSEGKIGAFGGSNWTYKRIEQANEYAYKHNLIPFSVSSPNFGLARQVSDPWGGGCVTLSGDEQASARKWYANNQMPVIAYSSLGRGFFNGKITSKNREDVNSILDEAAVKGYVSDDNFERLSRCELLAQKYGATVAQIAMAWIFKNDMNVFAIVSATSAERMKQNIEALSIPLTETECAYLNLKEETLR